MQIINISTHQSDCVWVFFNCFGCIDGSVPDCSNPNACAQEHQTINVQFVPTQLDYKQH